MGSLLLLPTGEHVSTKSIEIADELIRQQVELQVTF